MKSIMMRVSSSLLGLLFILLFISSSLAAGSFELRNGIHFGDTENQVREKETVLTESTNESEKNHYYGKIAGYSKGHCVYSFDEEGKLNEMLYDFQESVTDRDTTKQVYKGLYDSLCRKYGKPLGYTGGSCYIITGRAMSRLSMMVYGLGRLEGWDGDYIDYDEWVVDDGNDHIKIDMAAYYYRDSNYNYTYWMDVSYFHFTDQDMKDAQEEKKGAQDEVDNDM